MKETVGVIEEALETVDETVGVGGGETTTNDTTGNNGNIPVKNDIGLEIKMRRGPPKPQIKSADGRHINQKSENNDAQLGARSLRRRSGG